MKKRNEKLWKRAMGISRFDTAVINKESDWGVKPEQWTDGNVYTELSYLLSLYSGGTDHYDRLHGLHGKDDQKEARSDFGKLTRLCAAYAKAGAKIEGLAPEFE